MGRDAAISDSESNPKFKVMTWNILADGLSTDGFCTQPSGFLMDKIPYRNVPWIGHLENHAADDWLGDIPPMKAGDELGKYAMWYVDMIAVLADSRLVREK